MEEIILGKISHKISRTSMTICYGEDGDRFFLNIYVENITKYLWRRNKPLNWNNSNRAFCCIYLNIFSKPCSNLILNCIVLLLNYIKRKSFELVLSLWIFIQKFLHALWLSTNYTKYTGRVLDPITIPRWQNGGSYQTASGLKTHVGNVFPLIRTMYLGKSQY